MNTVVMTKNPLRLTELHILLKSTTINERETYSKWVLSKPYICNFNKKLHQRIQGAMIFVAHNAKCFDLDMQSSVVLPPLIEHPRFPSMFFVLLILQPKHFRQLLAFVRALSMRWLKAIECLAAQETRTVTLP